MFVRRLRRERFDPGLLQELHDDGAGVHNQGGQVPVSFCETGTPAPRLAILTETVFFNATDCVACTQRHQIQLKGLRHLETLKRGQADILCCVYTNTVCAVLVFNLADPCPNPRCKEVHSLVHGSECRGYFHVKFCCIRTELLWY